MDRLMCLVASFLLIANAAQAAGVTKEAPPVYAAVVEPDGLNAPKCRLRITYPAGPGMTRFSLSEKPGKLSFAAVSTTDPVMFNQTIHLVIDGWDAIGVQVGSEVPGSNHAGGVRGRDWRTGRDLMSAVASAAKEARSVQLSTPGKTVNIPVEGFREAMESYGQCLTMREI